MRDLNHCPCDAEPSPDEADERMYERMAESHAADVRAEREARAAALAESITRVTALAFAARLVKEMRRRHEPLSKTAAWFRRSVWTILVAERAEHGKPPMTMHEYDVVQQAASDVHHLAIHQDREDGRKVMTRRVSPLVLWAAREQSA